MEANEIGNEKKRNGSQCKKGNGMKKTRRKRKRKRGKTLRKESAQRLKKAQKQKSTSRALRKKKILYQVHKHTHTHDMSTHTCQHIRYRKQRPPIPKHPVFGPRSKLEGSIKCFGNLDPYFGRPPEKNTPR